VRLSEFENPVKVPTYLQHNDTTAFRKPTPVSCVWVLGTSTGVQGDDAPCWWPKQVLKKVASALESARMTTRRHYDHQDQDHQLAVDALEEVNGITARVGRCVAGRA
jgi:hypothetical protein